MKIVQYDDFDAWKLGRKGKISGTRLKDIVSLTGITKPMIAEELTALDVVFKKSDKKEILEALLPQESLDKLKKDVLVKSNRVAFKHKFSFKLVDGELMEYLLCGLQFAMNCSPDNEMCM